MHHPASSSISTAVALYQPVGQLEAVAGSTVIAVDSYIQDLSPVVQALDTSALVLKLDPHRNGIEQLTARLQRCSAIQQIHLLVQGRPGAMRLGCLWLTQATLEDHQTALQSWRQALAPQAQIYLHSPNVALGIEGMGLVGRLSQLTGAVVVASHLSIGQPAVQPLYSSLPLAS